MASYDGNVLCVALAGVQAAVHSLNIMVGQGLVDPQQLATAVSGIRQTLSLMPDVPMRNEYVGKIMPLFAEMERMATITWKARQNG